MIKRSIVTITTLGLISAAVSAGSVRLCVGCHGSNFEKKALNVSKIVKDLTKDEIVAALKGYKDGTYGGTMKATMQAQVATLTDKDIEAAAIQIVNGAKNTNSIEKKEANNKPVKKALLTQQGELGKMLKIVMLCEHGLWDNITPPPISIADFGEAYLNATQWAIDIQTSL